MISKRIINFDLNANFSFLSYDGLDLRVHRRYGGKTKFRVKESDGDKLIANHL